MRRVALLVVLLRCARLLGTLVLADSAAPAASVPAPPANPVEVARVAP